MKAMSLVCDSPHKLLYSHPALPSGPITEFSSATLPLVLVAEMCASDSMRGQISLEFVLR